MIKRDCNVFPGGVVHIPTVYHHCNITNRLREEQREPHPNTKRCYLVRRTPVESPVTPIDRREKIA